VAWWLEINDSGLAPLPYRVDLRLSATFILIAIISYDHQFFCDISVICILQLNQFAQFAWLIMINMFLLLRN